MPRGGAKKSHKGKHRQFTNPEELEQQRKQDLNSKTKNEDSSEGETSSEEEDSPRINNPNYVQKKTKKVSELTEVPSAPIALSRKEREEIAKQEAARRYEQLHREGKTEEARADLARLAIVRKQREEAAKKREEEKKEKEQRQKDQKTQSLNAIKHTGKYNKR